MDAIETYKHAGLTIEIHADDSPECPREWDNAGKLVIYGRGNYIDVNELGGTYFPPQDYSGWDELDANVLKCFPGVELLPVFRYEHSGVVYNTTGFSAYDSAGWDWSRVGFILCTRETMLSEWGKKIVTPKVREQARACMTSEIESYSAWANGEVYGYIIKDENGNDMGDESDSCWGFFGYDYVKQEAESIATSIAVRWFDPANVQARLDKAVSDAAAALKEAQETAGQQRLIA